MTPEQREIADAKFMLDHVETRRFLWRVIQSSGIFSAATDGSKDRHLAYAEGRRNLGLDILAMVETGQPVSHPDGLPILSVIQILREEANQQPQEKPKRERYDRIADLDPDDD